MFIPNIALYVKPKWTNEILSGNKTWEIRGLSTNKRGYIGILKSGNKGFMDGYVELSDCFRINKEDLFNNVSKHGISNINDINDIPYKKIYVWVLKNPVLYKDPIQINPKKGAIIWVKIKFL